MKAKKSDERREVNKMEESPKKKQIIENEKKKKGKQEETSKNKEVRQKQSSKNKRGDNFSNVEEMKEL